MAVDGDGVARLEIDGLGKTGEAGGRNPASTSDIIKWLQTPNQADSGRRNMAKGLDHQGVAWQRRRWTDLRCSEFRQLNCYSC